MEYGDVSPGRARPPEPPWRTVIATTVRLWLERHPIVGSKAIRTERLPPRAATASARAF